jgi:hypothetical protein
VLAEDQHGSVINVRVSKSDVCEIAAKLRADLAATGKRVTVDADKAYDTGGIVKSCREMNVTPYVARKTTGPGATRSTRAQRAMRVTRSAGENASRASNISLWKEDRAIAQGGQVADDGGMQPDVVALAGQTGAVACIETRKRRDNRPRTGKHSR